MKKCLLSILSIIYLGVSSGIAMEVHFCMGDKVGVTLYGDSDDQCGRCGMEEKDNGCCHDEHNFYKLSIDQKQVQNDLQFIAPVAIIEPLPNFLHQELVFSAPRSYPANHGPPQVLSGKMHCILHGVFRL